MNRQTALAACLGWLACASPCAAQVVWDNGQDPISQFRLQRASQQAPADVQGVPVPTKAPAVGGLTITAVEAGMSKFHRYDNSVHPYGAGNAWTSNIAPAGELKTPVIFDTASGTTIIFSNLEELLNAVVSVSQQKGAKVAILNLNAHGMPGGTWFAKDAKQEASGECSRLRQLGRAADKDSYNLYYTIPSREQMIALHKMGTMAGSVPCTTGAPAWHEIVARVPGIQGLFTDDAIVRFESCLVGRGPVGEAFSKDLAKLLLTGTQGRVENSVKLGLADWSMPEGMGFWDNDGDDIQLQRDSEIYSSARMDRAVMQKGSIRVTGPDGVSRLVNDQYFMSVGTEIGAPATAGPVHSAKYRPAAYRVATPSQPSIYSYMLGDFGSSEPAPEARGVIRL